MSSRFATLAQAISRTKHTAPSRMISGRLTSPTISSCIGTRRMPIPAFMDTLSPAARRWRPSLIEPPRA